MTTTDGAGATDAGGAIKTSRKAGAAGCVTFVVFVVDDTDDARGFASSTTPARRNQVTSVV